MRYLLSTSTARCAILNLIVGVVCDKTMEASRECSADDDADDKQAQVRAFELGACGFFMVHQWRTRHWDNAVHPSVTTLPRRISMLYC